MRPLIAQKMGRYTIGIDPGSPLYMAMINPSMKWVAHAGEETVSEREKGKVVNDPDKIAAILKKWIDAAGGPEKVDVCIEKVGPRPGEGILSVAKFVGSMYMVRGILAAYGVKPFMVAPRTWKYAMNLKADKKWSVARAHALFPDKAWRVKFLKDHNYAEAILLAYYLQQVKLGKL